MNRTDLIKTHLAETYRKNGLEAIQRMKEGLERGLREIALFEDSYNLAETDTRRAELIQNAVHYMTANALNNSRIDLAAKAQSNLSILALINEE